MGDSTALFCSRTQRLSALNETGRLIWSALDAGASCADAARELRRLGAPPPSAHSYVEAAAAEWLRAGYLTPNEVLEDRRLEPSAVQSHRAASLCFAVRCFGDADPGTARAVFAGLPAHEGDTQVSIDMVGRGGFAFLFAGDAALGMHAPAETAAGLKAQATDECCRAVTDGFLTHGALVSANGRRVLLTGAPGAGKTTLTLALAGSGFAYGGDDIVHVRADGMAEGVPFAAAAKEGAWPLLAPYVAGLSDLPVCERADLKLTRYVLPPAIDRDGGRPIDAVLLLSRQAGASARLEPVAPLEALCALLDASFSERGGVDTGTLQAFAATVSGAACRRLVYEDLESAVAAVRTLTDE